MMVQDLLLDFQFKSLRCIREDGSKGRLLYELAASYDGPQRQTESTSNNAVQVPNPYGDGICWIP